MAEPLTPLADRLIEALAEEYAAMWPSSQLPKRMELGGKRAALNLPLLLRALDRAGLVLAEREGGES